MTPFPLKRDHHGLPGAVHEAEMIFVPWYRKLHWQVLAALVLGVASGTIGGSAAASAVGWIGTLFIRLLRMIIVPLVITSIVTGVLSAGGERALGPARARHRRGRRRAVQEGGAQAARGRR
jgi:hypothetical protein